MALGRHSSTPRPLSLSVADVLSEGGRADNRWLVDLCMLPDIVRRTIAGHSSHLGALRRASAVACVLLDVVLDQRVLRPAVYRHKDSPSGGSRSAIEVDVPMSRQVNIAI